MLNMKETEFFHPCGNLLLKEVKVRRYLKGLSLSLSLFSFRKRIKEEKERSREKDEKLDVI